MKNPKETIANLISSSEQHHINWHYLNKRLYIGKVSKNCTYKPNPCPSQKAFGGLQE